MAAGDLKRDRDRGSMRRRQNRRKVWPTEKVAFDLLSRDARTG